MTGLPRPSGSIACCGRPRSEATLREAAVTMREPEGRRPPPGGVDGWVVIDKPVGMTSTQVVASVKRLCAARRAGHAGTLDPLASGVLPIALGEATKTVPF